MIYLNIQVVKGQRKVICLLKEQLSNVSAPWAPTSGVPAGSHPRPLHIPPPPPPASPLEAAQPCPQAVPPSLRSYWASHHLENKSLPRRSESLGLAFPQTGMAFHLVLSSRGLGWLLRGTCQ